MYTHLYLYCALGHFFMKKISCEYSFALENFFIKKFFFQILIVITRDNTFICNYLWESLVIVTFICNYL